jgi:S1-C subfamily serine protease
MGSDADRPRRRQRSCGASTANSGSRSRRRRAFETSKRTYEIYLVTNKHVIEEHAADQISVRLNPLNAGTAAQTFQLNKSAWFFHPNPEIDIAAIQ